MKQKAPPTLKTWHRKPWMNLSFPALHFPLVLLKPNHALKSTLHTNGSPPNSTRKRPHPVAGWRAQMCETFRWPTGRSSVARCAPRWRGGRDRVVAALPDCGDHAAEGGSPPKLRVAFPQGHPNSRSPQGTHLARGRRGTSRSPDTGTSRLSSAWLQGDRAQPTDLL